MRISTSRSCSESASPIKALSLTCRAGGSQMLLDHSDETLEAVGPTWHLSCDSWIV